jgi:hypothetical protein
VDAQLNRDLLALAAAMPREQNTPLEVKEGGEEKIGRPDHSLLNS